MAIAQNLMMNPEGTLYLLVTCSRDESRRDLAVAVTGNLAQLTAEMGQTERLVVFDNASTHDDHLRLVPRGAVVCRSSVNVGYWSAINWVLRHLDELSDFKCRFIYIVESDLIHWTLRPLVDCERLLDAEPAASSVRTQEFSVRSRWRYDKQLSWLPFHVTRSEVSLINPISGARARFCPVKDMRDLYLSNLHAKLPALHRASALQKTFETLAAKGEFTESDFFAAMMNLHPMIGVLDGGLYHSLISRGDTAVVTGSYATNEELHRLGYHATRKARIAAVESGIAISRAPY